MIQELLNIDNYNKKIDVILMNPPYDSKNTDLLFLEKIIEIADNVVSVQPVEWLQNPVNHNKKSSKYNKYKESISNYITNIEVIPNASSIFNIGANVDIGIYTCDDNGGFDYENFAWKKIDKKMYEVFYKNPNAFPKLQIYDETINKPFVNIKTFANNYRTTRYNIVAPNTYKVIYKGKLPNGDSWESKKYLSKSLNKEKPYGLYFDTYDEAINFYNSCLTECYKYIVSIFKRSGRIPLDSIPFMGDYTEPWTNERFFKFYKLNKDKQQVIIETMMPFMNNNDLINKKN